MANFYRRFVPSTAKTHAPLDALTKGTKKTDKRPILWNATTERKAFQQFKDQLAHATLLAHPIVQADLKLMSDASDIAIGAALEQTVDGESQSLGFFLKKLNKTQRRYSAYDRELLAIYSSIKFFRHLIEGRQRTVFTGHKPLTYAFEQRSTKVSPCQQRQLDYISQFVKKIRHIAGTDNNIADALSRVHNVNLPVIVTTEDVATAQEQDDELLRDFLRVPDALKLKRLRVDGTETTVYCDVSTDNIRTFIPNTLRRRRSAQYCA